METKTVKKELPACPVETTLMLIGDKWKVLILRDLLPGTKRFGELKKSIGNVSQKVLTAQLRDMESNGLVNRKVYPEVPAGVEYSLTELGQSLKPILDAMWDWGEEFKAHNACACWKICLSHTDFTPRAVLWVPRGRRFLSPGFSLRLSLSGWMTRGIQGGCL